MFQVVFWYEAKDREPEAVLKAYPKGMAAAVESIFAGRGDIAVRSAGLSDPACGLPDELLDKTDVLIWWGHAHHDEVPDELARKIQERVLKGMGFIALHSSHLSKPFTRLMGTSCTLRWRDGDRERLWVTAPGHPIAQGLPEHFELPREEMYGEYFDIPKPDDVVFTGWFSGGEVFRSGCAYSRGLGRVFYFQPGHETNPTFLDANIRRVLLNAVLWAAPRGYREKLDCPNTPPLERR